MKILKCIDLLEEIFSGVFFTIGITLIFIGVIMRYIFNMPLVWVDEFSVYFIIWGTIIGWSLAEKNERHIRVNILYDFLNDKNKRLFSIISSIFGILFSVFLLYASINLEIGYINTMQRSVNAAFPLWIVYAFFPFASALFCLRFFEKLVKQIKSKI